MRIWFLTPIILGLLLGCSQQDFSRPVQNPITGNLKEAPIIPNKHAIPEDKDAAELRADRLMKALVAWDSQRSEEVEDFQLGPGDVVDIAVLNLEAPGATAKMRRSVLNDGKISLPWVGDIEVAGFSVKELQDKIIEIYEGGYVLDPQVTVSIEKHQSAEVLVTGAVVEPGVVYLKKRKSSVLEILAQVGGLRPDASDELLVIKAGDARDISESPPVPRSAETGERASLASVATGGKIIAVDMKQLIDESDLTLNVEVGTGDIVTVRARTKEFVYVLGYVSRPGSYELRGEGLDAMKAVALAGGLNSSARAQNSFVVRESEQGQQIIPVDLIKVARGKDEPFVMEGGDTLVVGSSLMARLGEFVKPTVGAGVDASYNAIP